MSEKLGLLESVSMAVGGMVGGGIFAVLGVVAAAAGPTTWFAFLAAGIVAACAGYSFVRLNDLLDEPAGPITYVEQFTGNTRVAGMAGWTFVVGYVGTMGLYAYAFGGYFVELVGVDRFAGLPTQPVVSLAVVAVFVGLNLAGAHASGRTEDVLVGLKMAILLVFGFGGLYYGFTNGQLSSGVDRLGVGPLVAAAIAFVAFEGWELLTFDQDNIENPRETVRRAIFTSIATATAVYILVGFVTTNLVTPEVIQQHSETALAIAAKPFLGTIGFVLIGVAALFSTGSALNATLFSASRLARQLASEDMLPSELRTNGGEPTRSLLVLGVLTAALSTLGSLDAISSFASLAFITIFGAVSFLAFRQRSGSWPTTLVPAVGTLGAAATIFALLWHLYTQERGTFVVVVALSLAVIAVELFYFEREPIERELRTIEKEL